MENVREKRVKLEAEQPNDAHAKSRGWKNAVGHPDQDDLAAAKEFALRTDKKLRTFMYTKAVMLTRKKLHDRITSAGIL